MKTELYPASCEHLSIRNRIMTVPDQWCRFQVIPASCERGLSVALMIGVTAYELPTSRVAEIEIIPWCLIFSNLSTPVHLYYCPQIKPIHVFKRIILIQLVLLWNENARLEYFCQVMFCCYHFYCVRIEPHCKHRSIEFLTTQTDQSKRNILIDYVLNTI